jgi:hypothetical protein
MKLFIKNIIKISLLAALCLFAFAFTSYLVFASKNKNYMEAYTIKLKHLEQTKGKDRIVFIGGSNGVFSLNSDMMKNAMNKEVDNATLHAGAGLKYSIELFLEFIDKERDEIVILTEFELLTDFDTERKSPEVIYAMSLRPFDYPDATVWMYWLQRNNPVTYLKEVLVSRDRTIYHKDNFNEYGEVAHYPTQRQYTMPYYEKGHKKKFEKTSMEAIAYIKKTLQGYNYYVAPPVVYSAWDAGMLNSFDSLMHASFGNRYIGSAAKLQTLMTDDMFYNTIYHANAKGKDFYTNYLASALKAAKQ